MLYEIKNDILCVQVNSFGSELWSIKDLRTDTEHMWQGDEASWPNRAPTLFPVCGHLLEQKYTLDGKEYPMTLHGFLRDYDHELVEQSDTLLRFRLSDNEKTREIYPFQFDVDVVFSLVDDTLTQTFEVKNHSDKTMPFSIGYHPGFNIPFDSKYNYHDYCLNFEKIENKVNSFPMKYPEGRIPNSVKNSDRVEFIDGIFMPSLGFKNLESNWVQILEKETGRAVRVTFNDTPLVVFWSTHLRKDMPYVCIEPWYADFEPNEPYGEFTNRPGLVNLEKDGKFETHIDIKIVLP